MNTKLMKVSINGETYYIPRQGRNNWVKDWEKAKDRTYRPEPLAGFFILALFVLYVIALFA